MSGSILSKVASIFFTAFSALGIYPHSTPAYVAAASTPTASLVTLISNTTTLTIGESATIRAMVIPGTVGNALYAAAIDEVPPSQYGSQSRVVYRPGVFWNTPPYATLSYTFSPTQAGTYVFKPVAIVSGSEISDPSTWVTIVVNNNGQTTTAQTNPSSMTLTSDLTSMSLGQSATLSATFSPGAGNTLVASAIDEVPPSQYGSQWRTVYSGVFWNTTPQSALTYTFKPVANGTYVFKPIAFTSSSFPSEQTDSSKWVTIVVGEQTNLPSMTLTSDATTITLGQSTTLRATYTPGTGDSLAATAIDEVPPSQYGSEWRTVYSGSFWNTTPQSALTYTFKPVAAGTYVFKPYAHTGAFGYGITATSTWVTIVVNGPSNNPPTGYLDILSPMGVATGWAYDPDASSTRIHVMFFADGPMGTGTPIEGIENSKTPKRFKAKINKIKATIMTKTGD